MSKYAHMLPERSHAVPSKRPREVTLVSEKALTLLAPGAIIQRAALAHESLRPAEVVRMQQTLGNRAVGELLGRSSSLRPRIQAKLTVNGPGDEYEREADRVAEQVMRMPASRGTNVEEGDMPVVTPLSAVQRSGEGAFEVDGDFERQLAASRSGGQPLPPIVRKEFDAKFGVDFSEVRVHADAQSDALNRSVGANALTNGQDIFFRLGAYAPGSKAGQALLAHELTHVQQQGDVGINRRQRPAGVAAARIQAKWDFKNPNFGKTQTIVPLKDDFLVLKLEDDTGDTCILKGEAVSKSTAIEHLTQEVASGVMAIYTNLQVANVSSSSHWIAIRQAINRCMSATDAPKAIAALQQALNTGHLSIMSVAPGETTSAAVRRKEAGGRQTILKLLNKPSYLHDLGRLAALDVYTLQSDRVFSGNLGNWMSSVSAGRVTALIDNTDRAGNVNYFLGNMQSDPLQVLSNNKVTVNSSEANAKAWALDYAIKSIFGVGLTTKQGGFSTRKGIFGDSAAALTWLQGTSGQDLSKTHYQYFYDLMGKGWDDAVKKLQAKVTQPGWDVAITNRITAGSEQPPTYLIARLKLRNRLFLGV